MAVLLIESSDYKYFYPVSITNFLWDISCGIFTPFQRYKKQFHDVRVYSSRLMENPYNLLMGDIENIAYDSETSFNTIINSQYIPFENLSPQMNRIAITKEGKFVYLRLEDIKFDIIERLINNEIEPLLRIFQVNEIESGLFLKGIDDLVRFNSAAIEYETYLIKNDSNFISPNNNIYIDKSAKIQQFVSLQADNGPIIIDKGTTIRSFSIIDGPASIGRNCLIESARIRKGTTIKDSCRIGGEIGESIIGNYTNNCYESFIWNSIIGNFVDIGALSVIGDSSSIAKTSIICDYSRIGSGKVISPGYIGEAKCSINEIRDLISGRGAQLSENKGLFLEMIAGSREKGNAD